MTYEDVSAILNKVLKLTTRGNDIEDVKSCLIEVADVVMKLCDCVIRQDPKLKENLRALKG